MSELLERLRDLLPAERVSERGADLQAAAHDESSLPPGRADVVVWPLSTEETAAVVRLAHRSGTPITARGAGSGLEGGSTPLAGGIVLDFSRMNRVLEIRPGDLQADVEPGVVYAELNRQLRPHGLFFPPSPGGSSDVATIGGMVSTNASGIHSTKYGGTRPHVRAATVVSGTGEVLQLGNRCRKHSSGYDLLDLIVGSEGTLALLTRITLSLAGVPAALRRWTFSFAGDRPAAATIAELLRYGADLAAAEFLDRRTMEAIARFRALPLPSAPALFLEAHGSEAALAEIASAVESIARERGATAVELAGRDPWKEVRHFATRAIQALHPGGEIVRADVGVPISALPALVSAARDATGRRGLSAFVFGHAGIGVIHILIPAADTSRRAAQEAKDELIDRALGLGGAVSGEHGMGFGNRGYAERAFGSSLAVMKQIKKIFDPAGVLNPGKIWP